MNTSSSLQSSRSIPINENTPLLVPITPNANRQDGSLSTGVSPTIKGFRLLKRASLGDLTPSLGNQAGFLLLATTPPAAAALNRVRSANRTTTIASSNDEVNRAERGEETPSRGSVDLPPPTHTARTVSPSGEERRKRRGSDSSPLRRGG